MNQTLLRAEQWTGEKQPQKKLEFNYPPKRCLFDAKNKPFVAAAPEFGEKDKEGGRRGGDDDRRRVLKFEIRQLYWTNFIEKKLFKFQVVGRLRQVLCHFLCIVFFERTRLANTFFCRRCYLFWVPPCPATTGYGE